MSNDDNYQYTPWIPAKHRWFSGRIIAFQAVDPGSIPGRCIFTIANIFSLLKKNNIYIYGSYSFSALKGSLPIGQQGVLWLALKVLTLYYSPHIVSGVSVWGLLSLPGWLLGGCFCLRVGCFFLSLFENLPSCFVGYSFLSLLWVPLLWLLCSCCVRWDFLLFFLSRGFRGGGLSGWLWARGCLSGCGQEILLGHLLSGDSLPKLLFAFFEEGDQKRFSLLELLAQLFLLLRFESVAVEDVFEVVEIVSQCHACGGHED